LPPCFGFFQNRRGFRQAFRLGRFGLGQTDGFDLGGFRASFRLDGGGAPGAFVAEPLVFGFGDGNLCRPLTLRIENGRLARRAGPRDGSLLLRFGRLHDRGLEFLLFAKHFLLLDVDLFFRADLLDLDFLGHHGLPRSRLRQRTGLIGLRLLGLNLRLVLRLADQKITLRLGDFGFGGEFGALAEPQRFRRLDFGVALRLGLADRGCA